VILASTRAAFLTPNKLPSSHTPPPIQPSAPHSPAPFSIASTHTPQLLVVAVLFRGVKFWPGSFSCQQRLCSCASVKCIAVFLLQTEACTPSLAVALENLHYMCRMQHMLCTTASAWLCKCMLYWGMLSFLDVRRCVYVRRCSESCSKNWRL